MAPPSGALTAVTCRGAARLLGARSRDL